MEDVQCRDAQVIQVLDVKSVLLPILYLKVDALLIIVYKVLKETAKFAADNIDWSQENAIEQLLTVAMDVPMASLSVKMENVTV